MSNNRRSLWLMHGLPGSGKSTWIRTQELEAYALSLDRFRMLSGAPVLNEYGHLKIDQARSSQAESLLLSFLEARMANGDFTIIDRCHLTLGSMLQYQELAQRYRYEVRLIDFSGVATKIAVQRNQERADLYRVPAEAMQRMITRRSQGDLPKGIARMRPEDAITALAAAPEDWTKYRRIHHIGDLQGCCNVLLDYLEQDGGLHPEDGYVFTGDYVDRGREHERLLPLLFEWSNYPNVRFLEGNHERQLWYWATDRLGECSETFREKTLPHLQQVISPAETRAFCNRLGLFVHYQAYGREILASHGGLTAIPARPRLLSAREYTHGTGAYHDPVDNLFTRNTPKHQWQVHGHRNPNGVPALIPGTRGFCLEGRVEHGGALRLAILDQTGFRSREQDNFHYRLTA